MRGDLAVSLTDWLLTYWLHATVMLGFVALVAHRIQSFAARDLIWKVALLGPLVTASAHSVSGAARRVDVMSALPAREAAVFVAPAPASDATEASPGDVAAASVTEAASSGPSWVAQWIALGWRTQFMMAWAMVAGVLLAGLAVRRIRLMRSIGPRRAVLDAPLHDMLESLCLVANYPHAVRLTSSPGLASPVALPGHEICLPDAVLTELGPEQQRGVLAHELAHLVRRDPMWLGIAQVMERVFFLQPLNWLARRELQVTAEYLCDDWAARQVGSGLPLARCLLHVAEWIAGAAGPVPEPAMAARGSHLLRRVERLVRGDGLKSDRGRRIGMAVATVLLGTTFVAVPAVIAGESFVQELPPLKHAKQEGKARQVQDTVKSARVAALVGALKDSDPGVRAAAAHALGNLEDRGAANALAGVLNDSDASVRRAATMALAEMEDRRAIPGLEKMLTDPDADVRQEAANHFDEFDLTEAPAGLLAALKDSDADVRHEAAHAVGHIGDARAVPQLKALLNDPNREVRSAAVEALEEIGDPASVQALMDALKSTDPEVRKSAAEALGNKD